MTFAIPYITLRQYLIPLIFRQFEITRISMGIMSYKHVIRSVIFCARDCFYISTNAFSRQYTS